MTDASIEERLDELRDTAEAVGKLAEDKEAFARAVEAFRAEDVDAFRDVLGRFDLLERCHLICRWLCSKHCVYVCFKLAGPVRDAPNELPIEEVRRFATVVAEISADRALLERFVDVVAREDAGGFQALVKERKLQPFAHQLCHWLCSVRCRFVCRKFCPPPPLITHVANIPVGQIDAAGYAAGPSQPVGYTPADNKPGGVGDHPFGGWANIRGVFNVPNAAHYMVEFATNPAGPWTPIKTDLGDACWNGGVVSYTRGTDAAGWYQIGAPPPPCPPPGTVDQHGMGIFSMGNTDLTDWLTPAVPNDLYYLRLTVRTTTLALHHSPIVPVRIDNVAPSQPAIALELLKPDGSKVPLGCCETVSKEDGNKVIVTITASDPNFSQISVSLIGGCGVSLPLVDTGGTALSKTYNGNLLDTGYPVPTSFVWDPFAAPAPDPCCYLVYVQIWDRAIVNNFWSGGHGNVNWHSITIGG
ncbi:MAG: hypothetical protein ACXWXR_04855 [Candidatus Limnocylindrales bacterium]